MPKLTIEQSHDLEPAQVRTRLEALNARLAEKYGLDAKWKSDTEAVFDRTGATGTIQVRPGKVQINIDLSFALTPLRSKIETRIREELAKALGPETTPEQPA
jgi:putative polyhydroxyalkanoate system protein